MAGMLEYKCPCCDGAIKFDSTTQKLKCPYCDTEFEVDALKGYDEDLKDAKIHPENHRDLRVRMGGLSAYFIAMAPAQQDNIIRRFSR